jgi:hypothetical protein
MALASKEGLKTTSLNERLPFYLLGGYPLNLGPELSLSGLVFAGLGSTLGYRGFGLFLPEISFTI